MISQRTLGQQGLRVSALGLGCLGMSASYGVPDDKESLATLDRAVELGVTLFDTAEAYGPFVNEELVGRALKSDRTRVTIATKFGWRFENGRSVGTDSRPEHVKEVADASLRRLGTDYIDIFYQHRVDPDVPIEDTVGAMGDLVRQGKVRYLGLSEAGEATIRRAHAVHPISVLQSEYSLWERNLEPRIIATLRELGIGLVPFAPLGRGFLTGTAKPATDYPETDWRRTDPRFEGEHYDRNMQPPPLSAKSPRSTAPHRRRSRSRGCSIRARTSSPSPAPNAASISRKTSRPPHSSSARRTWNAWARHWRLKWSPARVTIRA